MVKNVTVTVVGEQRTSREENNVEPIELVTRGSLHEKDGVFYLKYDEYYEDLEKPARNLLKFDKLYTHKLSSIFLCNKKYLLLEIL